MNNLKLSDFDYDLPESFIAQEPLAQRDQSKLMVYNRTTEAVVIKSFFNVLDYLQSGDVVVINTTKVMPARLYGTKQDACTKIEILLLKKLGNDTYETLVKPLKCLNLHDEIIFGGELAAQMISKCMLTGTAVIRFNEGGAKLENLIENLGETPLPHYIKACAKDCKERYQTVYNKTCGSAAAPTAGLHWTEELMQKARDKGVIFCEVLLHVGLGTFRQVKTENITEHKMHAEYYEVSPESAQVIIDAKRENRRVVCVGTTALRTLEGLYAKYGEIKTDCGETDIFIYPPYKFMVADALITHFHLPRSTLLILVSALIGRNKTLELYELAKTNNFRFFSFGDCMFIH